MGRAIVLFLLICMISFFSLILVKETKAAPSNDQTFYWGSYFELTGPGAAWGVSSLMALRLAIEEVNAAGGFKVGNVNYKIKLLEGDTEGKTEKAVAVVTKQLTEHHPVIFSGPGISITAAPIIEMVKKRKDFINLSHATIIQNRSKESNLLFSTAGKSQWGSPDIVDYAVDTLKVKSVAIMAGSDEFGHEAIEKEYLPQLKRRGVKVTDVVYFPPETHDFYAFLSKIKQNKPDAIVICYYDPHTQGIIRQAMELGITKTFINRAGSVHGAEPFKDQIDHYIWTAMYDMDYTKDSNILAYKERYKKRYGRPPMNKYNDAAGLLHYDFVPMAIKAMQAAGTVTDVNKISAALQKTTYTGVIGKIRFQETRNAIFRLYGGHMTKGGSREFFPVLMKPEMSPDH